MASRGTAAALLLCAAGSMLVANFRAGGSIAFFALTATSLPGESSSSTNAGAGSGGVGRFLAERKHGDGNDGDQLIMEADSDEIDSDLKQENDGDSDQDRDGAEDHDQETRTKSTGVLYGVLKQENDGDSDQDRDSVKYHDQDTYAKSIGDDSRVAERTSILMLPAQLAPQYVPAVIATLKSIYNKEFQIHWATKPSHFLPTIDTIMSEEEHDSRTDYWVSVMTSEFVVTNIVGTFLFTCAIPLKHKLKEGVRKLNSDYDKLNPDASGVSDVSEKFMSRYVTIVFTVQCAFVVYIAWFSAVHNMISPRFGLAWEAWCTLLTGMFLSLLLQAVWAVARAGPSTKYSLSAFVVGSLFAVLPFIAEPFDMMKDAQLGGFCFASTNWYLKGLGVFSWLYLFTFHIVMLGRYCVMFRDCDAVVELSSSYGSIIFAASEHGGGEPVGQTLYAGVLKKMSDIWYQVLFALYKQTTPTKLWFLLLEDMVQAVIAVLYVCTAGGNVVVGFLNVAIPVAKLVFNISARSGMKRIVLPKLEKELRNAIYDSNEAKFRVLYKLLTLDSDERDHAVRRKALAESIEEGKGGFYGWQCDDLLEARGMEWDAMGKNIGKDLGAILAQAERHKVPLLVQHLVSMSMDSTGQLSTELGPMPWVFAGDDVAEALAAVLRENKTFTRLLLGDFFEVGDTGAAALSEALKVNSTVEKIDLSLTKVGDEGAKALAEMMKTNSTVTTLNLHGSKVGDTGAAALSEVLKVNSTVENIGLSCTKVGDDGAKALAEMMKTNSTVTTLSLYGSQVGYSGAAAISEALKVNSTVGNISLSQTKAVLALATIVVSYDDRMQVEKIQTSYLDDLNAKGEKMEEGPDFCDVTGVDIVIHNFKEFADFDQDRFPVTINFLVTDQAQKEVLLLSGRITF